MIFHDNLFLVATCCNCVKFAQVLQSHQSLSCSRRCNKRHCNNRSCSNHSYSSPSCSRHSCNNNPCPVYGRLKFIPARLMHPCSWSRDLFVQQLFRNMQYVFWSTDFAGWAWNSMQLFLNYLFHHVSSICKLFFCISHGFPSCLWCDVRHLHCFIYSTLFSLRWQSPKHCLCLQFCRFKSRCLGLRRHIRAKAHPSPCSDRAVVPGNLQLSILYSEYLT